MRVKVGENANLTHTGDFLPASLNLIATRAGTDLDWTFIRKIIVFDVYYELIERYWKWHQISSRGIKIHISFFISTWCGICGILAEFLCGNFALLIMNWSKKNHKFHVVVWTLYNFVCVNHKSSFNNRYRLMTYWFSWNSSHVFSVSSQDVSKIARKMCDFYKSSNTRNFWFSFINSINRPANNRWHHNHKIHETNSSNRV